MAVLSPTQLSNLRTKIARAVPYLSVLQPVVLLQALVNDAGVTRGQRSIPYNTGSGTGFAVIDNGMTMQVDTIDGTQIIRVKSITGTQASGTVEIDENGIDFTNGIQIRILHHFEVHPVPPSIRGGTFYKFYSTAYTNQNTQQNPVAIAGTHRAGFLSAGSITFDLDASPSYAIATGATIASYAWTCVKNGGGTTGITIASAASAVTTVSFTVAGQYWLSLQVTDSNGKIINTHRAIFVYDANNLPYKYFTIESFTGDWTAGGWRVSLNATGDVDLTEFPDWTLVVLWYQNYLTSTAGYVNLWGISDEILTCGYLRQDTDSDLFQDGKGSVSFQITTIDDLLNNVTPLGSVSLNATSAPSAWWQYASDMTAGKSVHHLLLWQAWGIFQCVDVYGLTDNALGVKNTDYTEPSLLQQINGFAFNRGIFAKLMSDRLGRLWFVEDSQMLNDAGRAALDTVMTIIEDDISGDVGVVRSPEQSIAFTQIDGFKYDGSVSTPYISIIPGYTESSISYIIPEQRGGSLASVSNQILSSQTDSNEKLGRYHALQNNNPRELRFANLSNYIGAFDIIPSIGWYDWGIANSDLRRNTDLFGRLSICRNITAQFDHNAGTIITNVVLEPEAIGPDGIVGNYPTGYPVTTLPTPDWDESLPSVIMAYRDNTNSNVGRTVVGIPGTITMGTPVTFEAGATSWISVVGLSATKALVCFRDEGDSNQGKAVVLTIAGSVVTPGTAAIFETGNTTHISACMMTATQVMVCYRDNGNSNQGTACILNISGTTVTPATSVVFETGATQYVSVTALTATKAIVTYSDVGNSQHGTACVLDVAASVITPATPAVFHGAAITRTGVDALTSNSAVVVFALTSNSLAVLTITGITTTFTPNGGYTLDATNGAFDDTTPGDHWVRAASATQCICAYQSANLVGLDFRIFTNAFTITTGGTVVIPGTPTEVGSFVNTHDEMACIALTSGTSGIVFYGDALTNGRAVTVDFVGGTVTSQNDEVVANVVHTTYTSIDTLE